MTIQNLQHTFVANFNADNQQTADVKLMTDEEGHLYPLSQIVDGNTLGDAFKVSAINNARTTEVSVKAGYIQIPFGSYAYHCWMTTDLTLTVFPSDQTSPRWSYIVAYVDRRTQYEESVTNNPGLLIITEIQGDSAPQPSLPSAQQIEDVIGSGNPYVLLSSIYVPANSSAVTPNNIVDLRTSISVKKGIALPASSTSGSVYPAGTSEESASAATPLKFSVISNTSTLPATDASSDIIVFRLSA